MINFLEFCETSQSKWFEMGPCPDQVVVRTVWMNFMKSMSIENVSDNLTLRVPKLVSHMVALCSEKERKHLIITS